MNPLDSRDGGAVEKSVGLELTGNPKSALR
jgi:hypothetical protein